MSGIDSPIYFAEAKSSLGPILTATTLNGICYIALDNHRHQMVRILQPRFPNVQLIEGGTKIEELMVQIVDFIASPHLRFNPKLDASGTSFQLNVWAALKKIRLGSTASYSQIAAMIGAPSAVRAVASACASNIIALAIPCHRVVRKNGQISGYRWGIEHKKELLAREQSKVTGNSKHQIFRSKVP